MLTSITLENFKGIGSPVRIPLKPITLMFGPNSSGKSTIIQAIHYAREILERNNVNPDRTQLGGSSIDLGGFRSLVHNHDLSLPIILRFDLDLTDIDLPDYTMWARYMLPGDYMNEQAPDISAEVHSAYVELTVMWSNLEQRPITRSYHVGINAEPMVRTTASFDQKQFTLEVNLRNTLFVQWFGGEEDFELFKADKSETTNWCELRTTELTDAVPYSWDRPLYIDDSTFMGAENFSLYLAQLMLGPGQILQNQLQSFRYLGPIRRIPARNHQPMLTPDPSRWADGTAAWDALYRRDDDTLIIELYHWMSERLKTGYAISVDEFREIPLTSSLGAALTTNTLLDDIDDISQEFEKFPTRKRLSITCEDKNETEVQPADVGVGISQVLPVLVLALDSWHSILAIEQPELHLHPAMQAELADLFIQSAVGQIYIEAAGKTANQFLIETHSEHLILRLLRRIRETTEDTLDSPEFRLAPSDLQVIYLRRESEGVKAYSLEVTPDGEFADKWPDGFFPERAKELF